MPTYDFKCEPCELYIEVIRPMSDESEVVCEKCKAEMRQSFSAPKIIYKGSGWAWQEKIPQNTDIVLG